MARISKNVEKSNGKYVGYIYGRQLVAPGPDKGKWYVGETTDKKGRESNWKKTHNESYGGQKITEARKTYSNIDTEWCTEWLERVEADSKEDLSKLLDECEDSWMVKKDSVKNGFNDYKNSGRHFSDEHRKNISKGHRNYQTDETKEKIRQATLGKKHTAETKQKISDGNKGKKRTPEQKAAQSTRMKGKEPVAASEGLRKYIEEHGHGPTKGVKQSPEARANMKAAQQTRGKDTIATFPDGHEKRFSTMLDAAKATGHNIGSVGNCVKSGGTTKKGYKFRAI